MSSDKLKILICGGTGFIGRNLIEHFAGKHEVTATYHTRQPPQIAGVKFVRVDLREQSAVQKLTQGYDVLLQAAATTSGAKDIVQSPALHVTDNVVMNSYIMRAAAENKVRHVVFFSCTVMYPPGDKPLTENDFSVNGVYERYFGVGWMKVYVEKLCEFFSRTSATRFSVLRHSNIYGPHDKFDLEKSHVFGATVAKVLGAENVVRVWGDGSEQRDFLFAEDLNAAVELCLSRQQEPYAVYNIGAGESISVAELVSQLIKASGKNLRIEFDRTKPTLPINISIDVSKAKRDLGWQPTVPLEAGIAKTLAWCKSSSVAGCP